MSKFHFELLKSFFFCHLKENQGCAVLAAHFRLSKDKQRRFRLTSRSSQSNGKTKGRQHASAQLSEKGQEQKSDLTPFVREQPVAIMGTSVAMLSNSVSAAETTYKLHRRSAQECTQPTFETAPSRAALVS